MKPLVYKIIDIEESITKSELRTLKKFLGDFTLQTNCGVDIHSSEMENGRWNGIKIERIQPEKFVDSFDYPTPSNGW